MCLEPALDQRQTRTTPQTTAQTTCPPPEMLEALEGLRRRSLIERGQQAGTFTL
jgi:hypothetical protein